LIGERRDAAGRFVIYVEETYVDQLKELRRSRENYSDVILRLAGSDGTGATVVKLAERG
jgi:predicted CopG family antitoxin